jgi:hypothetical protein
MIGDVCGVGERIGTSICKGFSAIRGTSCSWAIDVVATVAGSACDLVRRLAEAVDVDRAALWVAALQSRLFPRTHNGCHGDHEREIEPVHIADIVEIQVARTNGELSKVCLRLGFVAIYWICFVSRISPNYATRPACPHVDRMRSVSDFQCVASDCTTSATCLAYGDIYCVRIH